MHKTLFTPYKSNLVLFMYFGVLFGSWAVMIPVFAQRFSLNHDQLGLVLLALGLSAVLGLQLARLCMLRFGLRENLLLMVAATMLSAVGWILAQVLPVFIGFIFILGLSTGIIDVSMNVYAARVEENKGRAILSGLHGAFSLASALGAALSAQLLIQVGQLAVLAFVISFGLITLVFLHQGWDQVYALQRAVKTAERSGLSFKNLLKAQWFARFKQLCKSRSFVLLLGFMASIALLIEGAIIDWSILFARHYFADIPALMLARSLVVFHIAMAASRFSGDYLRTKFGAYALLWMSLALIIIGFTCVILPAMPFWFFLLGLALLGLGTGNSFPLLLALGARYASKQAQQAGAMDTTQVLALISMIGYSGFLLGPPLLGFIAQLSSLRVSFMLCFLFACFALIVLYVARNKVQATSKNEPPV